MTLSDSIPIALEPLEMADSPTALRVRAARAGDQEAFGQLVEENWRGLVGLARSVLAARGDAEDVVQDALVLAWQRLSSLRQPERFPAWVRRIVVRGCLRRLRRERVSTQLPEAAVAAPRDETRLDIERALASLSPRQRAVMHLTAEGRSDREIAGILGVFPATVRVHRFRATKSLRRILGDEP